MAKTIDDAVRDFLAIRDEREKLKRENEEKDKRLTDIAAKIEAFILRKSHEVGVTSFKTPAGTAGIRQNLRAAIGDSAELRKWVLETGTLEVFQSRLSSTTIKAYMEEHGGNPPPGVSATFENVVSITRPRS